MFSQLSYADDCEQITDNCAKVGEWTFSLAVGAGVYTNPLHGGDDIPLVLIPQISYYGEKLFFDNNTLGYSFFDNNQMVVSAITQLNHEKAYFTRWHPQNILIESVTSGDVATPSPSEGDQSAGGPDGDELNPPEQDIEVNIKDVSNKRWAIDAGIQFNWFINQTTDLQVQILHDVNNVYNGFNGQIELTRIIKIETLPNTVMSFSLGTNVNSKNLVDYYYGISQTTEAGVDLDYHGKSSITPYFRLVLRHQLSERWQAKLNIKRIFLDDAMTDSPLVKDDYINTIFAGVSYDF
jgi:outer membrane protein